MWYRQCISNGDTTVLREDLKMIHHHLSGLTLTNTSRTLKTLPLSTPFKQHVETLIIYQHTVRWWACSILINLCSKEVDKSGHLTPVFIVLCYVHTTQFGDDAKWRRGYWWWYVYFIYMYMDIAFEFVDSELVLVYCPLKRWKSCDNRRWFICLPVCNIAKQN